MSRESAPSFRSLAGWGGWRRSSSLVYRPGSVEQAAEAMDDARRKELTVTPRGAGLSYGDAALNENGAVLELTRMNRVLELDMESGVVRTEAGATIEDVWRAVLPRGWWLPVVPGTMKATLGGCVAMNVHGKNHRQAGAIGRHVLAMRLVDGAGAVSSVESSSDADRTGEVIGAMGLSGLIAEVTLRLKRVHSGLLSVEGWATPSLDHTIDALERGAEEADYAVAWVSCTGRRAGRGVIHVADHLPPDHRFAGAALSVGDQDLPARVAGIIPRSQGWRALRLLTNRAGMTALNAMKYAGARVRGRHRYYQSHAAFHFLLDYIPDWKRAYGRAGLMQYQMFIPAGGARQAFAAALRHQRALGVPSYLGVMKRHTAEASAATYCLDGYSLAMDFPLGSGGPSERLSRLCRSLDDIVREFGGRIYGAKDSVSRGLLPRVRDPAFSSDLAKRWAQD